MCMHTRKVFVLFIVSIKKQGEKHGRGADPSLQLFLQSSPNRGGGGLVWGWTSKIDSATRPFLKFDMRHGHLSDMRHGYFLKSTCGIGAKIVSDMRQGYFWLVTGDRAIFLVTLTCDMAVF